MRVRALMMAVIAVPFAAAIAAPPLAPKKEWKPCEKDADCVIVQGVCRPAAVNALFVNDAVRYYTAQAKETTCPREFWHPPAPVARCRLNSCETVQKD